MDSNGSYKQQYYDSMERAFANGEISVVDFHEARLKLNQTMKTGIDDGATKTKGKRTE